MFSWLWNAIKRRPTRWMWNGAYVLFVGTLLNGWILTWLRETDRIGPNSELLLFAVPAIPATYVTSLILYGWAGWREKRGKP
jgi:hypothetical protein